MSTEPTADPSFCLALTAVMSNDFAPAPPERIFTMDDFLKADEQSAWDAVEAAGGERPPW